MEFKAAETEEKLPEKAKEALAHIENRQYTTEFAKRGIKNIWQYGIAFWQKKVWVEMDKK